MLVLRKVADLDVSAASGLCVRGDGLWVVADDERFLARYDFEGRPLGKLALWPGELPQAHAERKRLKPDLEALVALPDDRLLALPSGSTSLRTRAMLIDAAGTAPRLTEIDVRPLYDLLSRSLPELNIEGGVVHEGGLWLAQRGNGRSRGNACIELDLVRVLDALMRDRVLDASSVRAVVRVELGALDGVALSLTDLAAHPRAGLLFCAAAEDSADTYQDGSCAGSVVGALDERGQVGQLQAVDQPCKLEGLACTQADGSNPQLWLVADPDDRTRSAPLFRSQWAG